jgi:hypothetical protein
MLESLMAPLPTGASTFPTEPASTVSPSSDKLLPSASKPRAVVDAGGALLPFTKRSTAMVDVVVASLPLVMRPRAVVDSPSLSSSSSVSTKGKKRRQHSAAIGVVVDKQFCIPGGVIVFATQQFALVVIIVCQGRGDFVEGKEDLERPTNLLSKLGSNAA